MKPVAEPAGPGTPGGDTPDSGTRSDDDPGKKRRPRALTVVGILAVAMFAIWGIGGPLFGTSVLSPTNEMVSEGPWVNAGYAGNQPTSTFLDDTYSSQLPSTILFKQQLGRGNVAEWNPYASGGSPMAALPDYAFFSPLSIPFYVLPTWLAPAYERLLEIVCAVGGSFLFLRRLSMSRPAALVGGMVFAGSGFMVTWLGFPQPRVAAFIPVLFWAVERFIQLRRVRDAALVALPVAALILGGFPAVTGYTMLTAGAYVLARLISQHRDELRGIVAPILYLAGSLIAGLMLTLFQLIPFLGFFKSWLIEGRNQSPSAALPTSSILTMVAPWAFGNVNPTSGDTQFVLAPNLVEVVSYIGAAAAVLALVAIAMPRQGRALLPTGMWVFFMAAAAVWAELVYVGGPPLGILQQLPVLRALFEQNYIGRARSIVGFLLAVLVALGFELVVRARTEKQESLRGRRIWAVCIAAGAVLCTAALVYHGRGSMELGAEQTGQDIGKALFLYRQQIIVAGVLIAVAIGCVVLLRFAGAPHAKFAGEAGRRRIRFGAAAVLIALIAAQGAQFMAAYYPHSPRDTFFPVTDTHTYLADNLGDQRYASTIDAMEFGTNTAYDLRALNGHAFLNANFAALVRGIPDDPIPYPTYIDLAPSDPLQATSPVLDVLGTKYFVAGPGDPIFGTLNTAKTNGTTQLKPDQPVTVSVPTTGPLRAIAVTPAGTVPDAVAAVDKNSTVAVEIRDSTGKQVTQASRLTAGAAAGTRLEVAVAADTVPATAKLTATITLHGSAPLTINANDNTPAVDTVTDANDDLRVVYSGSTVIYQRLNALPRIRWASRSQVVSSEDKRVQLLSSGTLPDSAVLLSNPGPVATGKPGTVQVLDDGTDTITTTVAAQGTGYLVVADADQVGWTASVDGTRADLVPADQGLVGVPVPAGTHTVVLQYGLQHQTAAAWLSAGTAVLLIALSFGEWWWTRRRQRPATASTSATVSHSTTVSDPSIVSDPTTGL